MLVSLSIRDLAVIKRIDLDLRAGLTVLTGETGAGKSILLDALGLATGRRADAALVRPGCERASVAATFSISANAAVRALLDERGIDAGSEVVVRRRLGADGRSRAFVNDAPVSVALLADLGELLVEIHGQHDQRGLLKPETHRAILDAFGGHDGELRETAACYRSWREARRALERVAADEESLRERREALARDAGELDDLVPEAGEDEALAAMRSRLANAQKIAEVLMAAMTVLEGEGALERLRAAEQAAAEAFGNACARLSKRRAEAARNLDRTVSAELEPLRMATTRFSTSLRPLAPHERHAEGAERAVFQVVTTPGAPPGPLSRIASGGELSRFMLAIKMAAQPSDPDRTLIFDEVDTGVGGAVSDAVGRRLHRLARGGQVLVVTHAPQVAARADCHVRIAKDGDGASVTAAVLPLDARGRREELARMLAGAQVTEAARAAADSLLRTGTG